MNENVNNKINIDSLLLRLPLTSELVQIISSSFNDRYVLINTSTGEELNYNKQNEISLLNDHINYKFWIRTKHIRGITNSYLYMIITSKMLKNKYFKGITQSNIKYIYDELMELNIFHCSFKTFMEVSSVTDIDFKQDDYLNSNDYDEVKHQFRSITKETKQSGKGYQNYKSGIAWNTRKNATKTKPFVKVYDKEKQLISECENFRSVYLNKWNIKDLKRFEFTIKDLKHLNRLGISKNSLQAIISLTNEEKLKIKRQTLDSILEKDNIQKTEIKSEDKLNPNDQVIYNLISMVKTDDDYSKILKSASINLSTRQKKSFMSRWKNRKQMFEISDMTVKNSFINE